MLLRGARKHRDNVSVLPICLNKGKIGLGKSYRHARDAALTHRISCTRPAKLTLLALLDSAGEGFHEPGDVVDGLGLGERGADFFGVFGVEMADHAG